MTFRPITTVVVDYGGVLTNPLIETFAAFARAVDVALPELQEAFARAARRHGSSPMADLETARCTETEMVERVLAELPGGRTYADLLGDEPFGEVWFRARTVNERLVRFLRELRQSGYRTALLTNNVKEWGPRWRAQLPVDELFDAVVDSSEEGVRKPDPLIYRRLLERLPATAHECLFLDDLEENCQAASDLGMLAVHFTTTDEAVDQIVALLRSRGGAYGRSLV
ncbi:HAD family hydrolase [Streptomyces erythrochromogenes]|uniref:HAD family hydrolase n=1 Tax=Streptomyces erythrochromogenes TaxID=285574 RepID=UPI0004CDA19B|nr:HAD family phosphatase [Streptomyces erythrochromogenes]MCX5586286.1 HAD family phosphatase [Streptomyces erythrochromogenes]